MVTIRWMQGALEDLRDIYNYMKRDSLEYATFMKNRFFELVSVLPQFPNIGRKVPEYDDVSIREIIFRNYRIIYHLLTEYIDILAVRHARRSLSDLDL